MGFFSRRKKENIDNARTAGAQIGGVISRNVQTGTKEAIKGMQLFEQEITRTVNVDFDQRKGNLFEYIESAKFNRNAANAGVSNRAVVTAADGRPHAAADIEIQNKDGKVLREVQAKFCDTQKDGMDTSAASTVNKQMNPKYRSMQRLGRKEDNFYTDPKTGKKLSFLEREKQLADARAASNGIHADDYADVSKNLTDELTDETTGVKSGGTSLEEMKQAANNPTKYARDFRMKQYAKEVGTTTANVAIGSMISSGIIAGVTNAYEVLKGEKELDKAAADTLVTVGKSGIRGAAQGGLGAGIRIVGEHVTNSAVSGVLSDSNLALVLAGGVIDCGVSVYDYISGKIDGKKLLENITDTTIKSATTVYFSKAAVAIFGASNPIITIGVYTVANYVIASTREILKNVELNVAEYEKATSLNYEMIELTKQYKKQLLNEISSYQKSYRKVMNSLLDDFETYIVSGDNVDSAIYAMVNFANQTGMALQHTDFNDFCAAMNSDEPLVLK